MSPVLGAVAFPHWHLHLDVWILVAALGLLYFLAVHRERDRRGSAGEAAEEPLVTRRQVAAFAGGLATLLLASDWPIHDLAEGYLYSVHMVQHLLFTLVAAALLLVGTPAWMARRLLGHGHGDEPPTRRLRVLRVLSRPLAGLAQFNLVLVLSHWPLVVEATVRYHPLHFVAHAVLLGSAVLMWVPVASPLREVPRATPPMQMLYLFLQTVVPTVPASFLTFGHDPLYKVYETFPRLWGISALTDQQTAGLIMKIGGGFFLWTVIAVIFFRWYAREERADQQARRAPAPTPAPTPPRPAVEPLPAPDDEDVLLWEDVEEELRRLEGGPTSRN
ncbi:MAG TPA: cytochrome c oxidase assembly protein [Acidimicrobiales bacterium]|nr:cytochrome c oxidase assembly protein [Acidimicrobiales bacterium]